MMAKQLAQLGRLADAKQSLRDGARHAQGQGDLHAAAEMNEMLTNLEAGAQ